ncbi:unnamed protein product [Lactuca virosa]|uniref:Leucine-rich repeat-containing N-terminal plant-type domain-containing protein n=1 Tax=Lactuca virosa TaxID=75947 RepID=A0AAU9MJX6_9ASTR|nr:unnamed protein product [Lactuca virosa]
MRKLWLGKFLLFFTFATTNLTSGCYEHERGVLLRFKRSLVSDPSGRLSSWNGNNCCQWQGVGCDNATGHVTTLDLGSPYLGYAEMLRVNKLKSSLAELTQLRASINRVNSRFLAPSREKSGFCSFVFGFTVRVSVPVKTNFFGNIFVDFRHYRFYLIQFIMKFEFN